jgi:hypothetical protein
MIRVATIQGVSDMPEIKIQHPTMKLKFSKDVSQLSAVDLCNQIARNLEVWELDATVVYSDINHQIRVTIKSIEKMIQYAGVIHSSIADWTNASELDSDVMNYGRRIRWR